MYPGKSKETLDVTMGGTLDGNGPSRKQTKKVDAALSATLDSPAKSANVPEDIPAKPAAESTPETGSERPITSSGWLGGWLSRPALQDQDVSETTPENPKATATEDQQVSNILPLFGYSWPPRTTIF